MNRRRVGYSVVVNQCNCHPETCCCDNWKVVHNIAGEKLTTFYSKTDAENLVKVLSNENP